MSHHLLHVFATFAPGGPQVRTVRLIEALGPCFRHSILAMDGRDDARALFTGGADVRLLAPLARAGSWRTVRALGALLREERPDLCLTYNWGAIEAVLAGRLAGLRILHHEDGFRPDEAEGFKRRRVLARRLLLRAARGVVVPSHTLERIALELWKLPRERVHLVPNGIRVADFPAADGNRVLRRELGIPEEAFLVGYVGHLRTEKNPARLVRALSRMRADGETHLLLLGEGPERRAVEDAARELGLEQRVHLVGHKETPQPCYQAMDAFALSSDTEQMPVALLEAMAAGLPVVATDVGDVARMLPEEGRAGVVPVAGPETERGLGAALDTLRADPERARELGVQNREHVQRHYGFERMLEAYRERYERALGLAERSAAEV